MPDILATTDSFVFQAAFKSWRSPDKQRGSFLPRVFFHDVFTVAEVRELH